MEKKYLFLLLSLTLSFFSVAQKKIILLKDVPIASVRQFNSKFPDAGLETWKKTNGSNYEASFIYKTFQTNALFDEFGNVLQIETIQSISSLAPDAGQYINVNYPGYHVENVVMTESGEEIFYFVNIQKEIRNSLRIVFDTNGNYLRTLYE